jgi:hypothetical protein
MWVRTLLSAGPCSFFLAVLETSTNSLPCDFGTVVGGEPGEDLETLVAPKFNNWRQVGYWVQSFSVKQCKYVI